MVSWSDAWNSFWFRPQSNGTISLMRIFTGLVVFYTHLVWTIELTTFLGTDGLLSPEYRELLFGSSFAWSHLDWLQSPTALFSAHVLGLIVIAMFTAGLWTRWTSVLTAMLVISYANRGSGALFGLDQINAFLCLYLMIGNCGGMFSVDAWRARRRKPERAGQGSTGSGTLTNISTRLIQIHMCIVYLFAAIGKLQGDTWFNGEAIWGAFASYEYQTLDMTWLADFMPIVAVMTLGALAWELAYAALIWPRLTRPIMLAIAIPVHLGIGICMGMQTFGLIMLIGNFAFVEPAWIERWVSKD
jgi:hypothetical protein